MVNNTFGVTFYYILYMITINDNNDDINYRFVQRGSGVCASDPDIEIRWFMNKDFRLAAEIAPGQKVVYDGAGYYAYPEGLNPSTQYYFKIFE